MTTKKFLDNKNQYLLIKRLNENLIEGEIKLQINNRDYVAPIKGLIYNNNNNTQFGSITEINYESSSKFKIAISGVINSSENKVFLNILIFNIESDCATSQGVINKYLKFKIDD